MNRLTKLANKYKTDKGTEFYLAHGFTEFYYPYFKNYEKPVILNLGVDKGASEKMLNDFYDGDCKIYCVDIEDKSEIFKDFDNIKFFKCDLSKKENIQKLISNFNGVKFDIIIDDASHKWADQFLCLLMLNSRLTSNGIYVLEDLHTSYESKTFGESKDFSQSPLHFLTTTQYNDFLKNDGYDLASIIDTCIIFEKKNRQMGIGGCSVTSIITFKR